MHLSLPRLCVFIVLVNLLPIGESAFADNSNLKVQIRLDTTVATEPVDGRLFVYFSQKGGEPRTGPNWFGPEPFYGQDVTGVTAAKVMTFDGDSNGFPGKLSEIKPGRYRVQALLDHDFYSAKAGRGEGNFYTNVVEVEVDPAKSEVIELTLNQTIPKSIFPATKTVKQVIVRSKLLSEFHDREVLERAAVVLPSSYHSSPNRRYPVLYTISGFGAPLNSMARSGSRYSSSDGEVELIHVLLTGECKWGHHVYANSATNGPRGDCLIKELIPKIDQTFRTVSSPSARFVAGHSSGGWSSLWLQVTYPDFFGGVWSTSPDPVDFRDFQQTNLYSDPPESVYSFRDGSRKPLARRGETPTLWYDSFGLMDDTIGRGGQLRSFEAVFSPVGPDGLPTKLWERKKGRINPEVSEYWKKYDIGLILKKNWDELKPKLAGKIHVTMGTLDTFYLNGATELLAKDLKEMGSDAEIELVPGAGHSFSRTTSGRIRAARSKAISSIFLGKFTIEGQAK